jgi:hypothetical protein
MDSAAGKQFLISKVIEQAELEHISLSEIETKMLHFTEVHPSLPDIYEVNDEFERDYDSEQYEQKIARLLKNARARDENQSPGVGQAWKDAVEALQREDHYILIMVSQAFRNGPASRAGNRLRDMLIYISVGVVIVLLLVVYAFWTTKH